MNLEDEDEDEQGPPRYMARSPYPYLRVLLLLDCQCALRAIELVLDSTDVNKVRGVGGGGWWVVGGTW